MLRAEDGSSLSRRESTKRWLARRKPRPALQRFCAARTVNCCQENLGATNLDPVVLTIRSYPRRHGFEPGRLSAAAQERALPP
jgi:hypothetical protein